MYEKNNDDKRIKERFQKKIAEKRLQMKAMLENIRRKQKLKRLQKEQELKELKAQISKDLLRANYIGDIKKCIRGKEDMDYRDSYCNTWWVESYVTNQDCHADETWCEMCCEHEFGNLYMKKRYECFDICDARTVKAPEKAGPGKWQWAAKYETGGDLTNPTKVNIAK